MWVAATVTLESACDDKQDKIARYCLIKYAHVVKFMRIFMREQSCPILPRYS